MRGNGVMNLARFDGIGGMIAGHKKCGHSLDLEMVLAQIQVDVNYCFCDNPLLTTPAVSTLGAGARGLGLRAPCLFAEPHENNNLH